MTVTHDASFDGRPRCPVPVRRAARRRGAAAGEGVPDRRCGPGPDRRHGRGQESICKVLFSELRRLGYVEGQNLIVERCSAEGRPTHFPEVAREVVRLQPDLILAPSARLVRALQAETPTIPIVGITPDPIAEKLVTSLARPGGNLTGFSSDAEGSVVEKHVELLKAAVPTASRVAVLASREIWEREAGARPQAGTRVGVMVVGALLGEPIQEPEYRRVFAEMVRERVEALVVADQPENFLHRRLIVELAA